VRLYREGKAGLHDPLNFGKLVHCLSRIAAVDNAVSFEDRIEALEQRLAQHVKPNGSPGHAARP
jgi:hypothetical protein